MVLKSDATQPIVAGEILWLYTKGAEKQSRRKRDLGSAGWRASFCCYFDGGFLMICCG